jgi:hypothetical protein
MEYFVGLGLGDCKSESWPAYCAYSGQSMRPDYSYARDSSSDSNRKHMVLARNRSKWSYHDQLRHHLHSYYFWNILFESQNHSWLLEHKCWCSCDYTIKACNAKYSVYIRKYMWSGYINLQWRTDWKCTLVLANQFHRN